MQEYIDLFQQMHDNVSSWTNRYSYNWFWNYWDSFGDKHTQSKKNIALDFYVRAKQQLREEGEDFIYNNGSLNSSISDNQLKKLFLKAQQLVKLAAFE